MTGPTEIAGEVFGHLRGIAKAIVEGHGGIFRELAKEHGEVDVMLKRVAASSDVDVRREFFPKIRAELLSHAKAEEREFYPLLKDHDGTDLLIEQALLEHQEIEQALDELHSLDYADPTWGQRFEQLCRVVETHVEVEESEIFSKAKDIFSDDQFKEVQERYEAARQAELEAQPLTH